MDVGCISVAIHFHAKDVADTGLIHVVDYVFVVAHPGSRICGNWDAFRYDEVFMFNVGSWRRSLSTVTFSGVFFIFYDLNFKFNVFF